MRGMRKRQSLEVGRIERVIMMVPDTEFCLLIKVDKFIWTSFPAEDQPFQRLLSVLVSFPPGMIKYSDKRQCMGEHGFILAYKQGYSLSLWGNEGKDFKQLYHSHIQEQREMNAAGIFICLCSFQFLYAYTVQNVLPIVLCHPQWVGFPYIN